MKRHPFMLGILILALAVCAVVLVQSTTVADPEHARVRMVHAVPAGPAVDVLVDGEEIHSDVSYTTVTTYTSVSAGLHTIEIKLAVSQMPLISQTVPLTGGMDFTIAGVGLVSSPEALFLVDNNALSNSDTARLVHVSPDTLAIDVSVTGTMTSTVVSNIPFKGQSGYISGLGIGVTDFEVRPAGQITPLLTFTGTLDSDTVNTFFIMGHSTFPLRVLYPLRAVHSVDQRFYRVFLPLVLKESTGE